MGDQADESYCPWLRTKTSAGCVMSAAGLQTNGHYGSEKVGAV